VVNEKSREREAVEMRDHGRVGRQQTGLVVGQPVRVREYALGGALRTALALRGGGKLLLGPGAKLGATARSGRHRATERLRDALPGTRVEIFEVPRTAFAAS
jgi:hypothetical protein